MIDEFVKQAKRLFSSKSNGGKQVPKLTDRLHTQKQALFALAIVLLLGYSQFRDHFKCQGTDGVDAKTVTDFCFINGTTTVLNKNHTSSQRSLPHVGLHFVTNDRDFHVVNHNYMRSLWFLLILLVVCSFVAQLNWANLFRDDVLQALLQLNGSDNSRLVQAAEQAKPYEMLSSLSSNLDIEMEKRLLKDPKFASLPKSERVVRKIELVDNHVNIYDHKLDYYPNQMIYLLLTKNRAAYKMSSINLRRRLIINSLQSTFFTLLQFLLPLFFVGPEYLLFGWNWAGSALVYIYKLVVVSSQHQQGAVPDNSIDYDLSSSIFPVSAQCEYQQYGLISNTEGITVQCTVPINEICGKLFVFIWWFVVVNLVIEIYMLLWVTLSSIGVRTISWFYGQKYWPGARKEADLIASFRYNRARLQNKDLLLGHLYRQIQTIAASQIAASRSKSGHELELSLELSGKPSQVTELEQSHIDNHSLTAGERKRREAEDLEIGSERPPKEWYRWCPRDICLFVNAFVNRAACCQTQKRRRRLEEEKEYDINIYYLFYLLYLRLGKSKSRTEEVIKMTARALENYLAEHEDGQRELHQQLVRQQQQRQQHDKRGEEHDNTGDHLSISAAPSRHQQPIISETLINDDMKLMG